jgi:putative hydrolase of the HAD superfamily
LKLGLISNEGEGITEYRVATFELAKLADLMVISHFTGMRKPDPQIWRLALQVAGAQADRSIYIDDRPAFAEVARDLGFQAVHHRSLTETAEELAKAGMIVPGRA